jgi:UDP-2,4-diacetamido-2,4,6-trideoxy-beta-L-altropyranose hydrolase
MATVKVLIRADASPTIGSGHVMRCLALAAALKALGAQVTFACRELPTTLQAMVSAQGHAYLPLSVAVGSAHETVDASTMLGPCPPDPAPSDAVFAQVDSECMAAALADGVRFDWVIVDHYQLDARWETAALAWGTLIAAIDDLADRPHAVDLLLDQNLTATPERYAPWLAVPCTMLFGPRYALLREEFQRPPVAVRERVARVLVNFGGMDAAGQTLKAVRALGQWSALHVDVVAGQDNPDWQQLHRCVAAQPQWTLQAHCTRFAELMASADVFIGAGGSTSWERAALGLPTLCVAVAANQQANAEAMAKIEAHHYLGPCEHVSVDALTEAINLLLKGFELRQHYARRSRQLVDGEGARRVAQAIEQLTR